MAKSICVFCSSSSTIDSRFFTWATDFTDFMAQKNLSLVYGGARVGLMGHFANEMLARKAEVHGVIPHCLTDRELVHEGITRIEKVSDMMERKRVMMEASDAFVAFPGGLGTLDEMLEVMTWKTLGELDKPIYFFNPEGFWDPFLKSLAGLKDQGFVSDFSMNTFQVFEELPHIQESIEKELNI